MTSKRGISKAIADQAVSKLAANPENPLWKGFGGTVKGGSKEVLFKCSEYLELTPDGTTPIYLHGISLLQDFLGHSGGSPPQDLNLSKPLRGTLYAMPKFKSGEQAAQLFSVMSGVRTTVDTDQGTRMLASQNVATVIPEASPRWIKVGDFDYKTLFNQTTVLPTQQNNGQYFEAFCLSIIDPDTGGIFNHNVQFRFDYEFSQTLPLHNLLKTTQGWVAQWTDIPETHTQTSDFAIVVPKKMTSVA